MHASNLCKAIKNRFVELLTLEKCLAACASGSWLLSPTYLEASSLADRFLPETSYEWSAALDSAAMAVGKERECIEAGSRWRIKLGNYMGNGPRRGAFSGWVVLLVVDESKRKGFESVLRAGLAKVYGRTEDGVEYSHCFCEKGGGAGVEEVRKRGVRVEDTGFISDWLQKERGGGGEARK